MLVLMGDGTWNLLWFTSGWFKMCFFPDRQNRKMVKMGWNCICDWPFKSNQSWRYGNLFGVCGFGLGDFFHSIIVNDGSTGQLEAPFQLVCKVERFKA